MENKLLASDLEKDIYDAEVLLGTTYSKNLTTKNYREILAFDENGEPVTFITNIFDLEAEDIVKLNHISNNNKIKKTNSNKWPLVSFILLLTSKVFLKCNTRSL